MRHRRGMMGLGALFDPNKPEKTAALASSEVGAVISNFLGTDKGSLRTVYGGCPKDVKSEAEAAQKCRFQSNFDTISIKESGGAPVAVARKQGQGLLVAVDPGRVNSDKGRRALANAVLRAMGAGVQVEDRALLKTKERSIGGAVLSTSGGGRVLVTGELVVPYTEAQIRSAFSPAALTSTLMPIDPAAGFDPADIAAALARKSSGKKRRRRSRK